jgi:hypothetical protein
LTAGDGYRVITAARLQHRSPQLPLYRPRMDRIEPVTQLSQHFPPPRQRLT